MQKNFTKTSNPSLARRQILLSTWQLEDYQANWRGARRYQFDEEARRKMRAIETRNALAQPRCLGPWDHADIFIKDSTSPTTP